MSSNGPPGPYDRVPEARVSKSSHATAPAPSDAAGVDRRVALRVGVTAAMAVGSVALGFGLRERSGSKKTRALPTLKDHRAEKPAGANDMAIVRGPDPAANVRRAVEALGGMGRFVKRGERVVIKPNIGWNRTPEQAANTNPTWWPRWCAWWSPRARPRSG